MEREFKVLVNPEKVLGGEYLGYYDVAGGTITNWNYDGYKDDLIHEYGHYLQEQIYGSLAYLGIGAANYYCYPYTY